MSIRAHIQYARGARGAFGRAELSAAAAAGNAMAVEYWHEVFMPLHFEESATARYGYQKRSGSGEPPQIWVRRRTNQYGRETARLINNPKYLWRKKREQGHARPLVWSGASARAARQVRITASATRGVGVLFALPKYFYAYRKDLRQPDKAAELTTVLDGEAAEMGLAAQREMTAVLNGQRPSGPAAAAAATRAA